MRRLYARQQDFFAACPARLDRWLTVSEADTRMQVLGGLNQPRGGAEVHAPALCHGVGFPRLSVHYWHSAPRQGMLLGYSADQTGAGATGRRAAARGL